MRTIGVGLLVVLAMACDGAPAAIDAAVIDAAVIDATDAAIDATDGPESLTCREIATLLNDRIEVTPRNCVAREDCATVGAPVDQWGFYTCNCGVQYATSCGGDPVNAEAWNADTIAAALLAEWWARCVPLGMNSGASGFCDCGPGPIDCVNDSCTTSVRSCFADAGVD